MNQLILTRNVTQSECNWLDRDFKEGEIVYEYTGPTYGCITPNGIACSLSPNTYPFFELPTKSVELLNIITNE